MGNEWFPLVNSRRFLDGSFHLAHITSEQVHLVPGATGLAYCQLREVPAPTGLDGNNSGPILGVTGLTEIYDRMPVTGEYWINYNTGHIVLNEDQIGRDFLVDYWGRGSLIEVEDINAIWRSVGLTATGTYEVSNPSDWWDVVGVPTNVSNAVDILAARTWTGGGGVSGKLYVAVVTSWTPTGDGQRWYKEITHDLGTIDVMVEGFKLSTNETIDFNLVQRLDPDRIRIEVADPSIEARILIASGGGKGATGAQGLGVTGLQGVTGPAGTLSNLYAATINTWTPDGSGAYYADLKHDLGTYDIIVQGFNINTQTMVEFGSIEKLDLDNIRLTVADPNLLIRVVIDASGGVRGHTGLAGPPGSGANYATTVFSPQWLPYGSHMWYADVTHGLGTKDVIVASYDVFTEQETQFDQILHTSINTVRLVVADNSINARILINAYGGMVGETGGRGIQGVTGTAAGFLHQIAAGTPPDDGTYLDGLFQWGSSYNAADALDDVNEVLKYLAPPPAEDLSDINGNAGVSGKLSFGASNPISGYTNHPTLDINGLFSVSGDDRGILNATTDITGELNHSAAAHSYAYPAKAFGEADKGTLSLVVNGTTVHSVDLSSFGSGSSVNSNGSGFNLSAATPVQFQSGDSFDAFKYRTGTYIVKPADQQNGYNTVEVVHSEAATSTNKLKYIIDDSTVNTAFSGQSISSLSMTGTKYLSGVNFHTGGTVKYSITASNVHRNTYSASSQAVNHTGTRCTLTDTALGNISSESDTEVISNVTATLSSVRIIVTKNGVASNKSIAIRTLVDRTVQTDMTSSDLFKYNLLMDNQAPNSTEATHEYFNDETYRVKNNADFTTYSGFRGSGSKKWTDSNGSQNSIVDTGSAGYNDGTQIINGVLIYPSEDFRNQSDGGSTYLDGPTGNPNYSGGTCSGERVYIRYFYNATSFQNFRLNLSVSNTTFVAASNKGSLSGNNCVLEFCAPGETKNASGFEWKDAVTDYTNDNSIGCYAASLGNNIPTNWGITIGTKSTANSGGIVCVRITCPSSWTGYINQMDLTWVS